MGISEFHFAVNQRLQDVASFKRNKYYPEEIDMALNKAMFRLLEKGVESRFQSDQINLGTVSALTQKNRGLDLIIPQSTDPLYEPSIISQYAIIPEDHYWTINARTEVVNDPLNCGTAPSLSTNTLVEYVAVIGYPTLYYDPNANPPFPLYPNLTISSSTAGTLYQAPPEIATSVVDPDGTYIITNNVVEAFYRNTTIRVYWERYRDVYYKGKFIFVSNAPLGNITISFQNASPAVPLTSITAASTSTNYIIYNRALIPALPSKIVGIATPRIEEQESLYQAIYQNRYYAPKIEEPIINQTSDYYIIYGDKSFLITRMFVDYIRKPRTISLALNQTCELSESTHQKIVDMAVEILRLDTNDPRYQSTTQDIELRS